MLNNLLLNNPAATGDKLYVEDVFSTWLYTGNGTSQSVENGVQLITGGANNTNLHVTGESLIDSSPVPKTLAIAGSVSINTSIKKYGSGSLYFNGSSKINTNPSSSVANLNINCTIEMWVYPTVLSNAGFFGFSNTSAGDCYLQWYSNFFYVKYGNIYTTVSATSASLLNTWTHLALVRNNNAITLYVNGVGTSLGTVTTNPTVHTYFSFGDISLGDIIPFTGYMDDIRVSQRAVYTANFTPPTAALPLDTLVESDGGMVWIKSRGNAQNNFLFDTVRGPSNRISSNLADAQSVDTSSLTAFTTNGFSLGSDSGVNQNTVANVSWTFRKAPKFFDVLTYTGNGVAGRTISHSLGVAPGMIIVKSTSAAGNWLVYHRSLGATQRIYLSDTGAAGTNALWNNTEPTSTNFTIGNTNSINTAGVTYVAYLFAHDDTADGVIQCGSTTTNGSGNATVTLGWEPQWVLIKATNQAESWIVADVMRGMPSGTSQNFANLTPNSSSAEFNRTYCFPTATGFQFGGSAVSVSESYIYVAIRRGPMRTPTDATKVYENVAYTGNGTAQRQIGSSVLLDAMILMDRTATSAGWSSYAQIIFDRLRGDDKSLATSNSNAEISGWDTYFDIDKNVGWDTSSQTSTGQDYLNKSGVTYVSHILRRAPGFFDVVCYTASYSANPEIKHNLGVAPELVIAKSRTGTRAWYVAGSVLGGKWLNLNDTAGSYTSTTYTGTAIYFKGQDFNWPDGSPHVAYLFASCPGVSKVGTFTGNGAASQTINCGFTNGARFVMIKRTDGVGSWYVWDSARGIISANDPYLQLNSTAAELTNSDDIDPTSVGFIVNKDQNAGLNENGWKYIYLAIA